MATVVSELLALLKLDDKSFKDGMNKAKSDTKSFSSNLKAAGQNISNFGNKMTVATVPIAAGLAIAVNASKNFNSSMANIDAILGITGTAADDLRQKLLEYGGSTRQGPQAVADAFYSIVSGVSDASTHMAILDAAVRTADAGQADLTATTSALISTMNSYKFSADDAAHVSDVFTRTVGMGVLTMDDLASAMPQVTGLASSLGIGIEAVGGQMAYLTTQGFSASQSATFLKSMMTSLLNPTADVQKAINALGYDTGEAMINSLGLAGSYDALKQYNNGTFAGLITSQEALQGATALSTEGFTAFNEKFQVGITGATDAAVAIQGQTSSWNLLGSKLQQTAITVGDQLTPVIISLIDNALLPALDGVLAWMQQNPELTNQLVLMAGAAVILGPVISAVGTAVSLVSGLVSVATGLWGLFSGALGIASAAEGTAAVTTGTLGTAMMAAIGPIVAVGAAIAGVIAAVSNFNNTVATGVSYARGQLADELKSGAVNRQQLDAASFGAVASQFGGGIVGDIAARLSYSNVSDRIAGKANGGDVVAGQPYMVGERGPELFTPDQSGAITPNGAMGGVNIYVTQQPGENGQAFAGRVVREMVRQGVTRG